MLAYFLVPVVSTKNSRCLSFFSRRSLIHFLRLFFLALGGLILAFSVKRIWIDILCISKSPLMFSSSFCFCGSSLTHSLFFHIISDLILDATLTYL